MIIAVKGKFRSAVVIGVGGFGFFIPRFVLKRMIRDRQRRITLALPDALDLTVICVEVGLALDQALMRVGEDLQHAHPDLSDEFHLVNLEMRAGKPRAEALRNLVERTGVDDVRALVATLIQTDRFGTSVSQALAHAFRFAAHRTASASRGTGCKNHHQDDHPPGLVCSSLHHLRDSGPGHHPAVSYPDAGGRH